MAFKNVFANNRLTKKFGGHKTGVADPYVTGYHFIWFDKMPDLSSYLADEPCGSLNNTDDMPSILAACCTGVTPPGGTLNKIEFAGLGGVKWAVPGNIDYGNTVSLKFFEMQHLPIASIMHSWVKMIRDYRTGVSNLKEDDYTKANYSALMYYWTTAPDAREVEYYACFDGMFPSKDPGDLFTSDVETVGKLDIEIEFNVDYAWHEKWVRDKCETFVSKFHDGSSGYGGNQNLSTYASKG